jgi:hypothetical protein
MPGWDRLVGGGALMNDFMLGWSVLAAFIAAQGASQRAAERFVRKEHLALSLYGIEHAEDLRGMRAAIQAARS